MSKFDGIRSAVTEKYDIDTAQLNCVPCKWRLSSRLCGVPFCSIRTFPRFARSGTKSEQGLYTCLSGTTKICYEVNDAAREEDTKIKLSDESSLFCARPILVCHGIVLDPVLCTVMKSSNSFGCEDISKRPTTNVYPFLL